MQFDPKKYAYPAVVTDTVLLTVKNNRLQVLLMKLDKEKHGDKWAVPGYVLEKDHLLEQNALKYLDVMGGISEVKFMDQIYAFLKEGNPDIEEPILNMVYLALLPAEEIKLKKKDWELKLFPIDELPPLAYEHGKLIEMAQKRLKVRLMYTNIVFALLPGEFTIPQLKAIYELILDTDIDKRNFRKKLFASGVLKKTGKKRYGGSYRPAELYEFTSSVYKKYKKDAKVSFKA